MRFPSPRLAFLALVVASVSVFACGEEDIISGEGLFPTPNNPSCDALRTCCHSLKDASLAMQCIQIVSDSARTSKGDATCKTNLDMLVAAQMCAAPPSGTGGSGGSPGFLGGGGSTTMGGFLGGAGGVPGSTGGAAATGGSPTMSCGSVTTPSPACDACLAVKCCAQGNACTQNAQCGSYLGCWGNSGCGALDSACQQPCVMQFSSGAPPAQALLACLGTACKADCGL